MHRHLCAALAGALVLACCSSLPAAQKLKPGAPYSLIFGTVFGPDGRPAQGVKINIRRSDQKKPKWRLVSDRNGEFAQRFPAGKADYIISAELKDRQASEKTAVTVHIENDERQDITLHLKQ